MSELSRHRETDDAERVEVGAQNARRWLPYLIGGGLAVLVALMIVLHLSGAVGPGAH